MAGDARSYQAAQILLDDKIARPMLVGNPDRIKATAEKQGLVLTGAEKLKERVAKSFEKRFGILPLEGYGTTETTPVASVNIPDRLDPGALQEEIDQPGKRVKADDVGGIGHEVGKGVDVVVSDPAV